MEDSIQQVLLLQEDLRKAMLQCSKLFKYKLAGHIVE